MSFCKWFYGTYKEGIKLVSLFLIGCLGIYILFMMLTPFLPLFSTGLPWTEYVWWFHLILYIEVCLFSVLGLIAYFTIVGVYEHYMKDAKGKKITFKVKPQWIVYTVAMIMLFTYIGYNGGYENGSYDGFAKGIRTGMDYAFLIEITDPYYYMDMFDTLQVVYSDNTTEFLNITIEDGYLMFLDTPSQSWDNITSWFFKVRT